MANKTIAQLSTVATVADIDEFEVQVSGETVTKKCTRKQLTQIEETARILQDDVIEASVGLSTAGAFLSMPNSFNLKDADFAAGITDESGATGALDINIANSLRILDSRIIESTPVYTAAVPITNAEALTLFTQPKLMLSCPAQTASKYFYIEILSCVGEYVNGTADFTTTDDLLLIYGVGGTTRVTFPFATFMASQTTENAYTITQGALSSSSDMLTKNIYAYMAANPTVGTGGYFNIIITYTIHSVNIL